MSVSSTFMSVARRVLCPPGQPCGRSLMVKRRVVAAVMGIRFPPVTPIQPSSQVGKAPDCNSGIARSNRVSASKGESLNGRAADFGSAYGVFDSPLPFQDWVCRPLRRRDGL